MAVQNWSEKIVVAELQDDPSLSDDLNALVDQTSANPKLHVVLDFSGANYVNSSNIAKLLKLRKVVCVNHHRRLKLCAINSQVWSVFLITGLDKLFDFSENVSLALTSIEIEQ